MCTPSPTQVSLPHARISSSVGLALPVSLARHAGLYVSRGYSNDSESSSTRDCWTIGPSYWCLRLPGRLFNNWNATPGQNGPRQTSILTTIVAKTIKVALGAAERLPSNIMADNRVSTIVGRYLPPRARLARALRLCPLGAAHMLQPSYGQSTRRTVGQVFELVRIPAIAFDGPD